MIEYIKSIITELELLTESIYVMYTIQDLSSIGLF